MYSKMQEQSARAGDLLVRCSVNVFRWGMVLRAADCGSTTTTTIILHIREQRSGAPLGKVVSECLDTPREGLFYTNSLYCFRARYRSRHRTSHEVLS